MTNNNEIVSNSFNKKSAREQYTEKKMMEFKRLTTENGCSDNALYAICKWFDNSKARGIQLVEY